jgi:hypothetical protein
MKNRPIHQNLDTSYVNLSALIKYLRRRQFVGSIKIQLNGYMADINLQKENQLKVSEHDQISGRISEGEEALQRVLIRAREPGGTINVYQRIETDIEIEKSQDSVKDEVTELKHPEMVEPIIEAKVIETVRDNPEIAVSKNGNSKNGYLKNGSVKISAGNNGFSKTNPVGQPGSVKKAEEKPKIETEEIKHREKILPDFPFALTNKVEAKAKNNQVSNEEWQTLLQLTAELLGVVDKVLARENLDFTAAFRKASLEISDDFPFINPNSEKFIYQKGSVRITEKISPKIFVASIIEALNKILDKLASHEKFSEIHRTAVQTLIALMNKRKSNYDRFEITPQLKRILGI